MVDLEAFAAALEDFAQANGLAEACGTVRFATTPEGNPVMVTLGISVNAPAIVAQDDFAVTEFETPVTADVLANDHDPAGRPLVIASLTPPPAEQGAVQITDDQKIHFVPALGFFGEVAIDYEPGRA